MPSKQWPEYARMQERSKPPYNWCETCVDRHNVYYDVDLRQHLCLECMLSADRTPKIIVATADDVFGAGIDPGFS